MRWLNTAIALLLGGITAGALALHYHWLVLVAVPIGMGIGGLVYNPHEVLVALQQAIGEVLGYNYLGVLRTIGRGVVNILGTLAGLAVGTGAIYFYATFDGGNRGTLGMMISIILALGVGAFVAVVNEVWPRSTLKLTGFRGVDYGISHVLACLLIEPILLVGLAVAIVISFLVVVLLSGLALRATPRVVRTIITSTPAIFFRLVKLVSTHDRLVIMASIAVWSLMGVGLGSMIFCGVASMAIGPSATFAAKAVVRQRSTMVT